MAEKKKKRGSFWKEAFKDAMRPKEQIKVIAGGHVLTDVESLKGMVRHAVLIKADEPGMLDVTIGGKERKRFKFERISWEQSAERSAGKAAAGAIIGGVLTGGLGAIAGAAVGGRKKDTSTAFLYLTDEDGEEHEIHIECTKDLYAKIDRLPW